MHYYKRGIDSYMAQIRTHLEVEAVADIPAPRDMSYFVAAPFHRGVRMELYRISYPEVEEGLRRVGLGRQP